MELKFLKVSIYLWLFPMMAIPGYLTPLPPLYQLVFFFGVSVCLYAYLNGRKFGRDVLYIILLTAILCILTTLNGAKLSSVVSLFVYIVCLTVIKDRFRYDNLSIETFFSKPFTVVYSITVVIVLLQLLSYKIFSIVYLIPDGFYLTSGMYETTLNNPISGWNFSFRPSAMYAEPSFMGFFVAMYVAFKLDLERSAKSFLFAFANFAALYFLGIRSGAIVLFLIIIFAFLFEMLNKRDVYKIYLLLFISSLVVLFVFFGGITSNLLYDTNDYSTFQRVTLLVSALDVFTSAPLFGVGLGNLATHVGSLVGFSVANVGNLFIQFLGELGVLGCTLLIWICFLLFRGCFSLSSLCLMLCLLFVGSYSLLFLMIAAILGSLFVTSRCVSK